MIIDFNLIIDNLPILLQGLYVTLKIALMSCFIGLVFGIFLAFIQTYAFFWLRALATFYITIIRGTPMLMQVWSAYFILPQMGIALEPLFIATIAIGLNSAAYISQIMRSGIAAIHKGQIEAARALGFSTVQTIWYIILPQALTVTLPALGNEFVTLIKDSSLASIIGVAELSKQGRFIQNKTWDAISVFFAVTVLYLFLTSSISYLVSYFEKKLKKN